MTLQPLGDPLKLFNYKMAGADVVIALEGDTAIAVDKFGNVIAESTNHASVIQAAINSLTNGGSIFISSGTYTITQAINLRPGLVIRGAGTGGSQLPGVIGYGATILSGSGVNYIFTGSAITGLRIQDLSVVNAGLLQLGGSNVLGGSQLHIENIWGINPPEWFIELYNSINGVITNVWSESVNGQGLLHIAQYYTQEAWNFGNMVITQVGGAGGAQYGFLIENTDNVNQTVLNLMVFIRPQFNSTNGTTLGMVFRGINYGSVNYTSVYDADLENCKVGIVLWGAATLYYVSAIYGGSVMLVQDPSNNKFGSFIKAGPGISYYGYNTATRQVNVYSTDLTTVVQTIPAMYIPYSDVYSNRLYALSGSDLYSMINLAALQSNPSNYGGANNPYVQNFAIIYVPSGTTLQPGVNTYSFYFQANVYYPTVTQSQYQLFPLIFKISGFEQADLDVETGTPSLSNNVFTIPINIINRTGSTVTLSTNLVMALLILSNYTY